jgi:hypothetical protein
MCLQGKNSTSIENEKIGTFCPIVKSNIFNCVCMLSPRLIATPLAASVGIREKARLRVPDNPILKLYYLSHSRNPGQVLTLHIRNHTYTFYI